MSLVLFNAQVYAPPHAVKSVLQHFGRYGCTLLNNSLLQFLQIIYPSCENLVFQVLDLLIKSGVELNATNKSACTALHVAVQKQSARSTQLLLAAGANPNCINLQGNTALHTAIDEDNCRVIESLCMAKGIDFSLCNKQGFNVLHYAALKGQYFATRMLSSVSAQLVNVRTEDGLSALHLAALNGHKDAVETLVRQGQADIDLPNGRNQTALLLAVGQGHCGVIELLVKLKANLNAKDEDEATALHTVLIKTNHLNGEVNQEECPGIFAIYENISHVAENRAATAIACYLIQMGIDLDVLDSKGQSTLSTIEDSNLQELLNSYKPTIDNNQIQNTQEIHNMESLTINDGEEMECLVCSEPSEENVRLEPCNHKPACEECSSRMKKCVQCRVLIQKRFAKDGRIILPNPPAQIRQSNAECIRNLECKIAEMEESQTCSICLEKERNVVFLCGHSACSTCADILETCHMCRSIVTEKIRFY